MIDITDESYESDLSEEESNKLLLLCGHAVGPQLSPAAQAVLDAMEQDGKIIHGMPLLRPLIAAALRAAADQVVPDNETTPWGSEVILSEPAASIRADILAIAAELEGQ